MVARKQNGLPFALITDTKKLTSEVNAVLKMGKTYKEKLHIVAVSVLVHLAVNGQKDVINRFYEGLDEAYKAAFRQYAGRLAGPAVHKENAWLNFNRNEGWFIINDRVPMREAFAKDGENLLKGKPFFEKNPREGEEQFIDDKKLAALIQGLLRRVEKQLADEAVSKAHPINPALVNTLKQAAQQATSIVPVEATKH